MILRACPDQFVIGSETTLVRRNAVKVGSNLFRLFIMFIIIYLFGRPQNSALPGVLGKGITSLILLIPVTN